MMSAVVVVVAVVVASQAAPPPDPSSEPPAVVPLAPSSPTTPNATPTPDARPHDDVRDGLAPVPMAFVQIAAGFGACCVSCVLGLVPVFGLGLIPVIGGYLADVFEALFAGGIVGATEGVVGDAFGQQRAALVWPIVAAVGTIAAATVASIIYNAIAGPTPIPGNFQQQVDTYLAIEGAILAGIGVVVAIAPAVAYAVTAVDKKPGDTGQGWPGLLEPASPQAAPAKRIKVAMAY